MEKTQHLEKKLFTYVRWIGSRVNKTKITLPDSLDGTWPGVLTMEATNDLLRQAIKGGRTLHGGKVWILGIPNGVCVSGDSGQ